MLFIFAVLMQTKIMKLSCKQESVTDKATKGQTDPYS